jgi:hypothetical protein
VKKQLLVDFDLRDRNGAALPALPRDIDTFFSWSALSQSAERILGSELMETSEAVSDFLYRLAYAFPDPRDHPLNNEFYSWSLPDDFTPHDQQVWGQLIQDIDFTRLLTDFTFNFLLLTQLDGKSDLQIVKFSYKEFLPYSNMRTTERLGLRSVEMILEAPSIGWPQSYHLQIEAPNDIALTDLHLYRLALNERDVPSAVGTYESMLDDEYAQVYTTSNVESGNHVVAVALRVKLSGYLGEFNRS